MSWHPGTRPGEKELFSAYLQNLSLAHTLSSTLLCVWSPGLGWEQNKPGTKLKDTQLSWSPKCPSPRPAHPSAGPDYLMCLIVVHDMRYTHSEWWGIKNLESGPKSRIFILAISLAQVNTTKLCKLSGHPLLIDKLRITTFIYIACVRACVCVC